MWENYFVNGESTCKRSSVVKIAKECRLIIRSLSPKRACWLPETTCHPLRSSSTWHCIDQYLIFLFSKRKNTTTKQRKKPKQKQTPPQHYKCVVFVCRFAGCLGIVMSLVWICTVYDSPSQHPSLSKEESLIFQKEGSNIRMASAVVVRFCIFQGNNTVILSN